MERRSRAAHLATQGHASRVVFVSAFDWRDSPSVSGAELQCAADKKTISLSEKQKRGLTREQCITFMRLNSITIGDNSPKFGLTKTKI